MKASIVIPAYNRVQPLRHTLHSVEQALTTCKAEAIVVDDGSDPALETVLEISQKLPIRIVRQSNQGSIIARLSGLSASTGEYLLFLDSDDIILPNKLTQQIEQMEQSGASLSYCDAGKVTLTKEIQNLPVESFGPYPISSSCAEVLIRIQPAPHCLMYKREYLETALKDPLIPADRMFDSVGDIWLNYNLAVFDEKAIKVERVLSATGEHEEERYTRHWEQLGIDALILAQAFAALCESRHVPESTRQLVGECAFRSWRKLPRDFHQNYEDRLLKVWRQLGPRNSKYFGGPIFQVLAAIIGVQHAGRILRSAQRPRYPEIATFSRAELEELFEQKFKSLRALLDATGTALDPA